MAGGADAQGGGIVQPPPVRGIKEGIDKLKEGLDREVGQPIRRAIIAARVGHYIAVGIIVYLAYRYLKGGCR